MSLHCILSCLNYKRRFNERDATCDRLPTLVRFTYSGLEPKLCLVCMNKLQQSDHTRSSVPVTLPDVFVCSVLSCYSAAGLGIMYSMPSLLSHATNDQVSWSNPPSLPCCRTLRSSLCVTTMSLWTCPQNRPPWKFHFLLNVLNNVCDSLPVQVHMHAWPTLEVPPIWSEPAMTIGDSDEVFFLGSLHHWSSLTSS